jgi:hypothetical protein
MELSHSLIHPDYIFYAGAIGVFLGIIFLLFFLYRRIRWIIRTLFRRETVAPGLFASLRNLLLIFIWTSIFGMVLFLGFFLRAYHTFTLEEPVAEIVTRRLEGTKISPMSLVQFSSVQSQTTRYLFLRGDQWMLEGDILKWDNWLNLLGLRTGYRLTRLRSRYIKAEEEMSQPHTVYSLVEDENNPLWRYLYQYGHCLPFISTVYGSAAFQATWEDRRYFIYVGTSGFIVRER